MNKSTSGILLALTLLGIFAAAAGHNIWPEHAPRFFLLSMLLMPAMCYLAERFDGGIPAFYEDIHRPNS